MGTEREEVYTDFFQSPGFIDRRKKTLTNKIRRFINDYWLVPVFLLYFELLVIVFPPFDSPLDNLAKRNLSFLKGPVVLYNIVTRDFPHVLVGHFKEIAIVKKYDFSIGQVSPEYIALAMNNKESIKRIYLRLIESRNINNTEIGGVATLVNGPKGPEIKLYEIESVNKLFSEKLHNLKQGDVKGFISLLTDEENKEILMRVGMDTNLMKNLVILLSSDDINKREKDKLIRDFIRTYDIHSESKYILSPYDFKSFLGSINLEGEYIGLFHFHNNYMEPPSDVDVQNSYNDRQLVITQGKNGIVIYDIIKGKETIYRGDLIS